MSSQETNKKTAEEGKNIKTKNNTNSRKKNDAPKTGKTKTNKRADVNSDVDQE